jgi:hypothetical protein
MATREITTRDRGLALISRLNRWLIAGAVGLSGLLSVAAAHAFHGHTRSVSSQGAGASSSATRQQPSTSGGGVPLQQPAQAPTSAPASAAPSPVVSGGS